MSYVTKNRLEDGGDTLVIGGNLTFEEGATITGGSVTELTPATASKTGVVSVGTGLSVTSAGKLSLKAAEDNAIGGVKPGAGLGISGGGTMFVTAPERVPDSTATTVAELVEDFNALLAAMVSAGLMKPESE